MKLLIKISTTFGVLFIFNFIRLCLLSFKHANANENPGSINFKTHNLKLQVLILNYHIVGM